MASELKQKLIWLIIGAALFIVAVLPMQTQAAMRSSSYVIYDSVMHAFDGPVISNVSASVSGQAATVEWDTNVAADSYVIYDTDSGFGSSREQGYSDKSSSNHSVELSGLDANTTYYYRVRSERVNGGITTDTTSRTFTTGSGTGAEEEEAPSGGGGGILIIDKSDKVPPEISNITVEQTGYDSVVIRWETDEEATHFVEYGAGTGYGNTYGDWATTTEHEVSLAGLEAETEYHFRALSSDDWGNVGYSDDQTFLTGPAPPEEGEEEEEEPALPEDDTAALDALRRLFPDISLDILLGLADLDELSGLIDAPVIFGEPDIEVGATEVTIRWTTDSESNSLIALAPESAYDPDAVEPYQQVVGNPDVYTSDHEVTLYGLIPDTTYHFQVRSQARFGPTARSTDYEFRTSLEELQIISYLTQIVDEQTAVFRWVTNKEADTAVRITPYYNGVLDVDQTKTIKDNAFSVVHELEISEFIGGTTYEIELVSADASGNEASKILPTFSTTEEDTPPIITHIKADSTIFVDRSNKTQTIISWLTNEPATSEVYYQEGVHGGDAELSETTGLNTNYTKEHVVVITRFKPGIVYSFRVESVDSGGNTAISKVHTFMTAKKAESIIQVILGILENTFGWLTKIIN